MPQSHVRRVSEIELMGFHAVGGGGPGGVFAGAGVAEYRKMHGEVQNFPWFNPYLPSVVPLPREAC